MNMILPKEPREIKSKSPRVLTLFGPSKAGKTTVLSELENCLIIDTEKGAEKIKGLIIEINNLNELTDLIKSLKENNPYKYLAIDTVDNLVYWIEKDVCERRGAKAIGDIQWGAGYDEVRNIVFRILNALKAITNLIIIGHRKRTIIGAEKVEIKVDSLNLTGKLKAMIMADSDAIGYIFREKDKLKVSFKGDDSLETGSRCKHLANKIIDFNWKEIFVD